MPYGGSSYFSPYQIFGGWGSYGSYGSGAYSAYSPANSYYSGGWSGLNGYYGNYSPSFNFDFNTPAFTQPPAFSGASPGWGYSAGNWINYAGNTESVTVGADAGDYQITAPTVAPSPINFTTPAFAPPSYDFGTFSSPSYAGGGGGTESVTVSADREPQQVQAPAMTFAPINFQSPFWSMPAISSPMPVEEVTVSADRPPEQVKAPAIVPNLPAFTPAMYPAPRFIPTQPNQPAKPADPKAPSPSKGGAASGGLPAPGQPKQQQQQQQQPQRPIYINQPQRPQQQQPANPYLNLTPQQLQDLLRNARTLTPQQRQQIQQALAQKQAQQGAAKPGGAVAPAQQKPASSPALPASPISPQTFGLALLAAGAVALAYKATHHKQEIAATVRRVGRRIKRTVAHA